MMNTDKKIAILKELGFKCQKQSYPYEDIILVHITETDKQEMLKSYEKLMGVYDE